MESVGSSPLVQAQPICLVIPTCNRPQYLKRLLSYYSRLKFPYWIFVADSSTAPAFEENRSIIAAAHDDLRVHYEAFDHTIRLPSKIAKSLSMIDADFAAICADDDFLVPEGIYACLDFLQHHADYSAAQGLGYLFVVSRRHPDSHSWAFSISGYQHGVPTLDQDLPADRLYQHLSNYRPTFYAVHRKVHLLDNMNDCARHTWDVRFGELLPSSLSAVQGKVKRLNVPYDVREGHRGQTSPNSESMAEILVSDDFSDRYVAFRECLTQELVRTTGEAEDPTRNAVNKAALAILGKEFRQDGPQHPSQRGRGDVRSDPASQRIRRTVRNIPIIGPAAQLAKRIIMKRFLGYGSEELSIIEEHVLNYADHVHRSEAG